MTQHGEPIFIAAGGAIDSIYVTISPVTFVKLMSNVILSYVKIEKNTYVILFVILALTMFGKISILLKLLYITV